MRLARLIAFPLAAALSPTTTAAACAPDTDRFGRHFAAAMHEMYRYQSLARICETHLGSDVAVNNIDLIVRFLRSAGYGEDYAAHAASDADRRARAYAAGRSFEPSARAGEIRNACGRALVDLHLKFADEQSLMLAAACRAE